MPLNWELRHKDTPSESPGVWEDSKIKFIATGPKEEIERIVEAIKQAIASKNGG